MNLEAKVLSALSAKPASGGAIIERFQAEGAGGLGGRAVLVYGALANLRARGEVEPLAQGAGETIWGRAGAVRTPPREPGRPPTFSLGPAEIETVDRELARATADLPPHYFEELRRVVVADADRRSFHGATPRRAVAEALADLAPRAALRPFLRRVESGGPVRLRLRALPLRWAVVPLVLVGVALLLRLFVIGVYTIPDYSVSMAPTLFPAAEHGDSLVVVSLLAYRFGETGRGDVVAVAWPDGRTLVKRAMGLGGETIELRGGDLFVDGELLVKERALLDRVRVPLLAQEEFEATEAGLRGVAHGGYRLPDGGVEGRSARCNNDVVVSAGVTLRGEAGSVTFTLHGNVHAVALNERGGAVALGGEAADVDPLAFRLEPGVRREVWITNADGVFRVELDGREVHRSRRPLYGGATAVAVAVDGSVQLDGLELARDLFHEGSGRWAVGEDEVFLLGDNSADSQDSRSFGPVSRARLRGKVLAVAWPPSRVRRVR
jgi:signal peptidase I